MLKRAASLNACVLLRHPLLQVSHHTFCSTTSPPTKNKHDNKNRKPKQWDPNSLILPRVEEPPTEKEKRASKGQWTPTRTLPHHIIDQIRMLHREDPKTYNIQFLMARFKAPFEAIKRILHSKFVPSPEKIAKREEKRRERLEQIEEEEEEEVEDKVPERKETIDTHKLMLLIQHKSKDKTAIKQQNNTKYQQNFKHANSTHRETTNNNFKHNQLHKSKNFTEKQEERKPTTTNRKSTEDTKVSKQTEDNNIENTEIKTQRNEERTTKPNSKRNEKIAEKEHEEEKGKKEEKKEKEGEESKTKQSKTKSKEKKKTIEEGEITTALVATAWVASQIDVVVGPDSSDSVFAEIDAILKEELDQLPKEETEVTDVLFEETEVETKTESTTKTRHICTACEGKGHSVIVNIATQGVVEISLTTCKECLGKGFQKKRQV